MRNRIFAVKMRFLLFFYSVEWTLSLYYITEAEFNIYPLLPSLTVKSHRNPSVSFYCVSQRQQEMSAHFRIEKRDIFHSEKEEDG